MDDHKRQAAAVLAGIVLAVSLTIAIRYEPYTFIRRDGFVLRDGVLMGLLPNACRWTSARRSRSPGTRSSDPGYPNLDMYWSNISVGRGGAWYPKHSFLVSVAAAPFYLPCSASRGS